MKFILLEIKLWFKNESISPKSYLFKPNKINVITGSSSTGKTTIWRIVDYCLLSGKTQIADKIANAVSWFGIRLILDGQEISIARSSPENGIVSQDIYFSLGPLPEKPVSNQTILKTKQHLNKYFNFSNELKQAYNNLLSYRHFLIFCTLTEKIIAQPDIYFDQKFFSDDFKYSGTGKMLNHIFELIIGANNVEIKATNKATKGITREINQIIGNIKKNEKIIEEYKNKVKSLIDDSKKYNFIDSSQTFKNENEAITLIEQIIIIAKSMAVGNSGLDEDDERLNQKRNDIILEIQKLKKYKREYENYRENLRKLADSLQPIEFLNENLSNQLANSYETQLFLQSLADSFSKIKKSINQQISPLDVSEDLKVFEEQLNNINRQIKEKNKSSNNFLHDNASFINIGNIEGRLKSLLNAEEINKIECDLATNLKELQRLNDKKDEFSKESAECQYEIIKLQKIRLLNECIQKVYTQLNWFTEYSEYSVALNIKNLTLDICPPNMASFFPISEIGSQANYVFLHLCMYLALHIHMFNMNIHYVPQIIFIDQPSIPFLRYEKDQEMLQTIFHVLNSFIDTMVIKNKTPFQIILTEHALPSDWEKLPNFILIDEFIDGNALIPNELI
ncbi:MULTISPECIES: DUF3732 domain-containing protein [Snodgrassella]|uniref:DUF3732 domain-containing protein n=1 Tax=Snodgrassella TaxID=1193515 RepID=UPI0008159183|nr:MULTISPECIES: DUF3732 domain-containing protein [Snodgrassella]SCB85986.1 Protein of unknown function [Snodgrassella sp. R-53583]